MATAAPTQELPLFYNALEPLNSGQHASMKIRRIEKAVSQSITARNAIEDKIFEHISNQTTVSQATQNIIKKSAKIRKQIEEKVTLFV